MSILVDKNTRLVVQGITGSAGAFHTRQCMDYGTNVVAGVTPGKGGQIFDDKVPVFDTVWEARQQTHCNASMVFVPAPAAADSILEAVDAGVELVVCITEGIPVMDMLSRRFVRAETQMAQFRAVLHRRSQTAAATEFHKIGRQWTGPLLLAFDYQSPRVQGMSWQEQVAFKLCAPSALDESQVKLFVRSVDLVPNNRMTK